MTAALPSPARGEPAPGAPRALPRTADFLIIGGGIIGITLARELRRRHGDCRVVVLEKEPRLGLHATGRCSGVLHAGFYYSADSLKARFTRDGNRQMSAYCRDRGLSLHSCGKLVVATGPGDLAGLDELLRRGRANDVPLEVVAEDDLHEIEPRARTFERALFSPTTAAVDPAEVLTSLARDAEAAGVEICSGVGYLRKRRAAVQTTGGPLSAGYVINAAGVHADRVARDFGFSERYRILPFKGLYLLGGPGSGPLRTHIYPVPVLANPFLGVHFTVTVRGRVKIGPTATPAFWREQYTGLANFSARECLDIISRELGLLLRNDFGFGRLAVEELRKYRRRQLVARASRLATGVRPEHFGEWGRPGIRAQLLDVRARRLEMDFRHEGDDRSFHVLNAVSPAFTCALPFSAYLAERIAELAA